MNMRHVISDTNCIIHLEKCDLLKVVLTLPYKFIMPEPLFHDEWLGWNTKKRELCSKICKGRLTIF